jgi:hypothetical protein
MQEDTLFQNSLNPSICFQLTMRRDSGKIAFGDLKVGNLLFFFCRKPQRPESGDQRDI